MLPLFPPRAPGPPACPLTVPLSLADCQFELSGADGVVRSSQVEQEEKTRPGQAVDCIWTIRATPRAKVRGAGQPGRGRRASPAMMCYLSL